MRAPEFWGSGHRVMPALLSPLGLAYAGAGALRRKLVRPWRAAVPVVCVGNLTAGGAGKTPTVLAFGQWLRAQGRAVHYISRGYGGTAQRPTRVDPARHDARAVGDEALLLAASAPTWVARHRPSAARAAAEAGADIVVMDDGHQNPALYKDLSVVVIDGGRPLGNGRVIPAGPLRERPREGLARADAVVIIDDPVGRVGEAGLGAVTAVPVLRARLIPGPEAGWLADSDVVAFAGIGRPGKFFDTLRATGCRLVAVHDFADHHDFDPDEIMLMAEQANAARARLVTTAKDAARLPFAARAMVEVVTVKLEFERAGAIERLLGPVIGS